MTNRERLQRTLEGKPVDRPPVCFYEINGYDQDVDDPDEFNIFNDPSWKPLVELATNGTDRIVLNRIPAVRKETRLFETESFTDENGSAHTIQTLKANGRMLTKRSRRDRDVFTTWTTEHLLKTPEDALAYLSIKTDGKIIEPDFSGFLRCERALGETGLAAFDTCDAICAVASLFSMEDYLVTALTEKALFAKMLEREHERVKERLTAVSKAHPGRMYRIYGPEYASPPYLPPELFEEYVVRYDRELIDIIHASGGFARIHSHGNLSLIIGKIAAMGADGLDPIEPPPQGDMELSDLRREYGRDVALFGNIELSEIETLEREAFENRVRRALAEGMEGPGRGFVLMPSACPIGRKLSDKTLKNYETMARLAKETFY